MEDRLEGVNSTYDVITKAAKGSPDKIAFHYIQQADCYKTSQDITYAQLSERVTQTANLFFDLGCGPKDVISYILPNILETHYVLWGGEAAGIVNPINPLLEVEHIASIMRTAQAKTLVTLGPQINPEIWQKVEQAIARVPTLEHVVLIGGSKQAGELFPAIKTVHYEDCIGSYRGDRLDSGRQIKRDDICSLFHTGGTTGTPKMAQHSHFNEVSNALMTNLTADISSDDVGLCGLPLFHVNAAIVTGLCCFLKCAKVILATPAGYRTSDLLPNFWNIVEHYKVTYFSGVPTIYAGLLQVPLGGKDVSSLRVAICGAAPMPKNIIHQFEHVTGLTLIEGYGMTEGTCVSSCNPLAGERPVGSVGLRIPYQEMKTVILDSDQKYVRDCQCDEIGTVVIKGPNVFKGYLKPEDNDGVWLDGGWFNTGDMGRQDEKNYFWLTGRTKELIIRGGHNIDPALIENALILHDSVAAVAAVGKPDSYAGEVPVAYVVQKPGVISSEKDLISFARQHISERAAVPKKIYRIDALPLTAIGKVFKPALQRDAVERTIRDALICFDLSIKISVEPDKTYGTVASIKIDSSLPVQEKVKAIKDIGKILSHYTFHTKIN